MLTESTKIGLIDRLELWQLELLSTPLATGNGSRKWTIVLTQAWAETLV